MLSAPLPPNEAERLEALRAYGVLDTEGESDFDDITALASHICGTPIALVTLIDAHRQWFLSRHGLEARETPRDLAFCAHAILNAELLVVEDAHADERFADNPFVTGEPHVRFYAGTPLVTPSGHALGTLCVIDSERRSPTPDQRRALEALGRQVVAKLELTRTTRALRESEQQLRAITSSIRSGILVQGPGANILWSNEAACELLGVTHDMLMGRTSFDPAWHVIHADGSDFPTHEHPAVEALRTGWSVNGVVMGVYRPQQRDRIWLQVDAVPQFAMTGTVSHVIVTFTDITRRKLAEDRIADDSARYQSILSSSPLAIISTDLQGIITTFNAAAERLLGYRAEEVVDRCSPGLFHEPDEVVTRAALFSSELGTPIAPGFDVFIAKALRDLPNEHEWTYVRKTGGRVPVLLSVVVVRDGAGVPTGYMGVAADITARQQAERALVAAKELAEESTRAKSDFLATMSHEIRTPMNGVLGMTALLFDTALTPEQRGYAGAIERSGKLLLGVINDILDFSKLEAGKLQCEQRPFDIAAAAADVADLLAPTAALARIEFVVSVAPETPTHLIGDPGRVRQVLLNLAGNAVKFTSVGHVHLRISYRTDSACPQLRVDVHDTGIGIPAGVQARLFNAFSQADASTTRRFGGTGLGLSISRRLVELMGGTIGVTSTEGVGSTFWFEVPLAAAPASDAAPLPSLSGMRVIVAEPLDVVRTTVGEELQGAGALVQAVSTRAALNTLLSEARAVGAVVDAIIVDAACMPSPVSGIASAFEEAWGVDAPPVIVTQSFGARDDVVRADAAGAAAYVAKPLAPRLLVRVVATVVERRQRGSGGPMFTRYTLDGERPAIKTPLSLPAQQDPASAPSAVRARVLLAEDNPVNQLVAVKLLEKLGCAVDLVEDGRAAFDRATAECYDVIFMDVQMPVMDGLEATQLLRAHPAGASVPVIAMTANAMAEDRERCLAAGMSAFVSKPITVDSLRAALEHALRGKSEAA